MSTTSTGVDALQMRRIALLKFTGTCNNILALMGIGDLFTFPPVAAEIGNITSDEDQRCINDAFVATFPGTTFAMRNGQLMPLDGDRNNVVHVEPWLVQEIRRIDAQIDALQIERNVANGHLRSWKQYEFAEKMMRTIPLHRSLKLIAGVFKSKTNRDLSADGGDTNAELRTQGISRMCEALRDHIGIDSTDTIMDGGSAYNYTLATMAQYLNVKVVGVEYVENRVYLGAISHLKMLDEIESGRSWWIPESFNRRIAFGHMDLTKMTSFDCVTILYLFDEAFDESLLEHIWKVVGNSPRIRAVISFKASKHRSLHAKIEEWSGFKRLKETVQVNKTGSGESNTVYFYTRGGLRKPDPSSPLDPESLDDSIKDLYKDNISKVWNESIEKARGVYKDTRDKTQLGAHRGIVTRGQKRQATDYQCLS